MKLGNGFLLDFRKLKQISTILVFVNCCNRDAAGNPKALLQYPSWEDFLRLAFDEIRFYEGEQPASDAPHESSDHRIALAKRGIGPLPTHTLRHSYRSWLDAVGTPIGVLQELMRHSDIRTTMNLYGDVVTDEMAQAHAKVVGLARASGRSN